MTTPAPSTDTTTTNAGQSFKIGVTNTSGTNINTAYGSLGTFPYMTADNRPDQSNLADLYLKVWQDSTTYTAIKNGWSVVSGTDTAAALKTFSTAMSSATDPWSDYRFAILNKIDLSAYASQHNSKFIYTTGTVHTARAAGYYLDYFVGYCVYEDTKGGVCAEASVETTWDSYHDFNGPAAFPIFSFAAARFKKEALIIKLAATDTAHTPVAIINAENAVTGVTAIAAASLSEIVGTDAFVGTSETFGQSRRSRQSYAQLGAVSLGSWSCATGAGNCGGATGYNAVLATTNLDYTAVGQSGFAMIGAGASYKAGAMWSYLWGWVPTTTAANQTHDLTFESGVKYIDWNVTRDLFVAAGANGGNGTCAAGGCATGNGLCAEDCRGTVGPVAIPARTAKDLTVTRVAMSGSSLVASAAAAIVAASLAF